MSEKTVCCPLPYLYVYVRQYYCVSWLVSEANPSRVWGGSSRPYQSPSDKLTVWIVTCAQCFSSAELTGPEHAVCVDKAWSNSKPAQLSIHEQRGQPHWNFPAKNKAVLKNAWFELWLENIQVYKFIQEYTSFVFHLETKVLESGWRVEKLIAQVAWSPVLSFHSLWWFGCNVICWCWSIVFFGNQRHCIRLPRNLGALHASFCRPAF